MPLELHIERDDRGWRRARVSEHLLGLSEFLEADMQGSVRWCDDVLRHIEAVITRSRERWQRTGGRISLFYKAEELTGEVVSERVLLGGKRILTFIGTPLP
jgi:uncharacterized protein YacL (UPF0231 family)